MADLDLATSVRSGLYHQDLSLKLNPQVRIPGTLLDLLNFSHVTDTFGAVFLPPPIVSTGHFWNGHSPQ